MKKWLNARRGRMTVLAQLLQRDKASLYKTIFENRVSNDLFLVIERKKIDIEAMENECLKKFPFFIRFIRKGEGRIGRLSEKLDMPVSVLRGLAHAKKDGRYIMMKHGVERIMTAINEIENERKRASYNHEKIDIRAFISDNVRKSKYSLENVVQLANLVRQHADCGDRSGAVICRIVGENQYRILSIGFDTVFNDMCRSHVCDKDVEPHIHAALFAAISVGKKEREKVGEIMAFSHVAPCPNCTERLIGLGVSEVYCTLEPELMGGMNMLGDLGIPVYKYSAHDKSIKTINSIVQKIA